MSAYTASKHAFGAFSDSLRMEMAMFDIKVLLSPNFCFWNEQVRNANLRRHSLSACMVAKCHNVLLQSQNQYVCLRMLRCHSSSPLPSRAQVSIIEPGFMKTPIVTGAASMLQRMADNLPAATRARYSPDFIERAIGSASKVRAGQRGVDHSTTGNDSKLVEQPFTFTGNSLKCRGREYHTICCSFPSRDECG
jgi:hypothetical protein